MGPIGRGCGRGRVADGTTQEGRPGVLIAGAGSSRAGHPLQDESAAMGWCEQGGASEVKTDGLTSVKMNGGTQTRMYTDLHQRLHTSGGLVRSPCGRPVIFDDPRSCAHGPSDDTGLYHLPATVYWDPLGHARPRVRPRKSPYDPETLSVPNLAPQC